MRIAVTGGAGYIGSVITERLVDHGHAVLVVDNLSKGHRDTVPREADFSDCDLADRERLATLLTGFRTEAVVHMAADSLVGESVTEPGRYYRTNVVAGLSLLDAMRQAECPRLVFSSTAAVYGEPEAQPIGEDDPTVPTNPYGETKLAFERALRWHARAYGLSAVSLRYFNAAGATLRNGERHEPETHLIPLVLGAAAGVRPPVTVFGTDYPTRDGTCVRDYVHVDDLADAHERALHALGSRGTCDVFNLGCGGSGYSVRDVIDTARRVTGRDIPTEVAGRRPGDPPVLVASAERIRTQLGWTPRHGLEDIVSSAWQWMLRQRHTAA